MSPALGQAYLQILHGLSNKEGVLKIHRRKHDLSSEDAEEIWGNYLEFIALKAHYGDTSGKHMRFATSPKIEDLWKTHILNT